MAEDLGNLAPFALAGVGTVLVVFAIGAQSGWLWAVKSLDAPPPPWILGALAAGGLCYAVFAALQANWLSALLTAALYSLIVAGTLRIGPFGRKSGGGRAP